MSLLRSVASLAVGCAIALIGAAPASADHGPALLDETFAAYVRVAQAHWGGPPPACVAANGALVPVHATLSDDPDPAVTARAEQPGCRIWLDRDFWPARPSPHGCVEIAHEWGHLLGHGHTEHGLMSEEALGAVPGCTVFRRASRRLAPASAARRARARRRCAAARRCHPVMTLRRAPT
jgi:hypothetical protein